jgi:hypothetical protein
MRKEKSSQVNEMENESVALLNTQCHFMRGRAEVSNKL